MKKPREKIIRNPIYSGNSETDVDNSPIPEYDTVTKTLAYETPQPLYHTGQPRWEEQRPRTNTYWLEQDYDFAPPIPSRPPKSQERPYDRITPDLSAHDIVPITHRMETMRLAPPPVLAGSYDQVIAVSSEYARPIALTPTCFKLIQTFVWGNVQRRITTVVNTSLIISGIIGAYFGISSTGSNASTTPNPDAHNCTYPEGVNATFAELQETLTTGNDSLRILGLDQATCSLINMVINDTVSALKTGGYNCWQNVQSALMPLTSSAVALSMDNIAQIITAVKQYCFPTSSTALISSMPITTTTSNILSTATTTTSNAFSAVTTSISNFFSSLTSTLSPSTTSPTVNSTSAVNSTTSTTQATTTPTPLSSPTATITNRINSTASTLASATSTTATIASTAASSLWTSFTTLFSSTSTNTTTTTTTSSTASTTTPSACCEALQVIVNKGACPSTLNSCGLFGGMYNCSCTAITRPNSNWYCPGPGGYYGSYGIHSSYC